MPVLIDKILRAGEGKIIKRLEGIVVQVNAIEDDFAGLSDAELRGQTEEFRSRLADGETLDEISRVLKIDDNVMRHLATRRIESGSTGTMAPAPAMGDDDVTADAPEEE